MENKKEMTAPNVSVGADTEQPIQKCTDHSISDYNENIKSFEEMQREMLRQLSPSYLKTVSMAALYDTVFDIQTPLIDGLLQRGTYLFVGSPKVGKSFMMAQLAYHISTGTPLWDYKVRKTTVLYFALEDDYPRLQKRLFQMFGAEEAGDLYFATESKTVNGGLEEQIRGFMQEHPDTGLIIIDTLKRVREAGGADYSYASDYDIVARLKALADSYKVTMLIVHHTRKQKAEDIFDMKHSLSWWGISKIGIFTGALMSDIVWEKLSQKKQAELTGKIQKLSRKFAHIDYTKPAHTNLITKFKFLVCRMMQQSIHQSDPEYLDGKYWAEQGWLDSGRPWK